MTKPLHPPTKTTAELAHLHVPDFLMWDRIELHVLTNVLRDGDATQVYMALREYSDFVTGEFNGGYHNLMALCTPPRPERGPRRLGPSYKTMRRIIDDLIKVGLVQRLDAVKNKLQGQLRLQLTHIFRKVAPVQLEGRKEGRIAKGRSPRKSTTYPNQSDNRGHDLGHGSQENNTPLTPQTAPGYPQPVTPHGEDNRPPEGAGQAPQTAPGQVAAAPLMASTTGAVSSEAARKGREAAKALAAAIKKQPKQPLINRDELQKRLNVEAKAREQRLQAQTQQGKGLPSTG